MSHRLKGLCETDKAIFASLGGTAGDIAFVPAPHLKYPKGIRDIEEWYISTVIRRDYVYQVLTGSVNRPEEPE